MKEKQIYSFFFLFSFKIMAGNEWIDPVTRVIYSWTVLVQNHPFLHLSDKSLSNFNLMTRIKKGFFLLRDSRRTRINWSFRLHTPRTRPVALHKKESFSTFGIETSLTLNHVVVSTHVVPLQLSAGLIQIWPGVLSPLWAPPGRSIWCQTIALFTDNLDS